MATNNPTSECMSALLAFTAVCYTVHHAWKFDRFKCLTPSKKDWFRVMMTWMLLLSMVFFLIYSLGWCWVKYSLGFMYIPGEGYMAVPWQLWEQQYLDMVSPLTGAFAAAYCLVVSLSAEESLYWFHLMGAVRSPGSSRSWLRSWHFSAWIVLSLSSVILIFCTGWAGNPTPSEMEARSMTSGALLEIAITATSCVLLLRFPKFLKDVQTAGASPAVRARLHFFNEANKVRTFFRIVFATGLLTLGVDGLTKEAKINHNPLLTNVLYQASVGALFCSTVISIMLYLPRSWGSERTGPKGAGQVFVRNASHRSYRDHQSQNVTQNQITSQRALMTLLREGGHWDDVDDEEARITNRINDIEKGFEGPLAQRNSANVSKLGPIGEYETPSQGPEQSHRKPVPSMLESFTTPFSVQPHVPDIPTQIRIQIEQEVHQTTVEVEATPERQVKPANYQPDYV